MHKSRMTLLVLAVLGILGSILPWASFMGESAGGLEGDGVITLILFAIAGAICFFLGDKAQPLGKGMNIVVMLAGGIAAIVGIIDLLDIPSPIKPGIGLWLVVIAGALMVVMFFLKKKEAAAAPARPAPPSKPAEPAAPKPEPTPAPTPTPKPEPKPTPEPPKPEPPRSEPTVTPPPPPRPEPRPEAAPPTPPPTPSTPEEPPAAPRQPEQRPGEMKTEDDDEGETSRTFE